MHTTIRALPLSLLLTLACGSDPLIDRTGPDLDGEGEGEDLVNGEGEDGPVPTRGPIAVYRNGAPVWALEEMQAACDVWISHGLPFALTDDTTATIYVKTLDVEGGIGGLYTVGETSEIYVLRGPGVDGEFNQACILAAELGRIVGVTPHTGDGGLMSEVLPFVAPEQVCPWTVDDDAALCAYDEGMCT